MKVHYRCLYLPYNKKPEGGRPQKYWATYHYTLAVKNGSLGDKSKFDVQVNNKKLTIGKDNAALCRADFGGWIQSTVVPAFGGELSVVPVPSKDMIVGSCPPYRSLTLAQEICGQVKLDMFDALRWTEQLEKASKGARRDAQLYFDKLTVKCSGPKRVMLVDDVYTSGCHLKAARKRLAEAGHEVVGAVVCGKTIDIPQMTDDPFAPGIIEVAEELNPFADLAAKVKAAFGVP